MTAKESAEGITTKMALGQLGPRSLGAAIEEAILAAVAAEREACAKVAEDYIPSPACIAPEARRAVQLLGKVAERIRARSQP